MKTWYFSQYNKYGDSIPPLQSSGGSLIFIFYCHLKYLFYFMICIIGGSKNYLLIHLKNKFRENTRPPTCRNFWRICGFSPSSVFRSLQPLSSSTFRAYPFTPIYVRTSIGGSVGFYLLHRRLLELEAYGTPNVSSFPILVPLEAVFEMMFSSILGRFLYVRYVGRRPEKFSMSIVMFSFRFESFPHIFWMV